VSIRAEPRRQRLVLAVLALAGCDGPQSALVPAGRGAARITDLFWGMTIGLAIVWLAVVALAIYAYTSRRSHSTRTARLVIIGGGVVFPIVVLTGLLIYGLAMMPSMLPSGPPAAVRIHITGHQYWWRVRYIRDGRAAFELANEVHLPVGQRVEFELESRDVIHSFWIPALGGKVDMIPGRTTRAVLEPTDPGIYRGTCAEYCGTSHAWMSLYAVVEDAGAYERWFAAQAAAAIAPTERAAIAGAEQFLANGCGACHAIRGTAAKGVIGPDLTHVGSRQSLAAGALPNNADALRRWIARTTRVKPAAHMPAFGMLPTDAVDALAIYLEGLQ
jgi:cytochrome c oxidase subunit II